MFIVLQLIDDIIRDNISIGSKNQINLIVGKRQQGCWHMAAMLSAAARKVAGMPAIVQFQILELLKRRDMTI